MTATALVVDADERRRRLACDALNLFHPGFRVSSAVDLTTASVWVETIGPDLIVIDPSIAPATEFRSWWTDHDLGSRTTLVYTGAPEDFDVGGAIVHEPSGLPEFMRAVRSCVAQPEAQHRTATTQGSMSP